MFYPNAVTAEMMSMNDFDSITIDMQHGLVDYQTALNMLQVISGSGKTPMVRVPWNEPGIIMKSLDCLLYTSPSPRDKRQSRMPSSA